jgi:nucleoside-diphosphate-sugar epimerase
MKKIYATGSTGTIGKYLRSDIQPVRFDLSSSEKNFKSINFDHHASLIHLAGVVGPSEVQKNIELSRSVNVDGTGFLAREFIKKSEGVFYFVSTSHVYTPSQDLISETSPIAPTNIYAQQKYEAECLLENIFSSQSHRLCIIRVFSVLDWGVAPHTLGGAIRKLTETNSDFILSKVQYKRYYNTI